MHTNAHGRAHASPLASLNSPLPPPPSPHLDLAVSPQCRGRREQSVAPDRAAPWLGQAPRSRRRRLDAEQSVPHHGVAQRRRRCGGGNGSSDGGGGGGGGGGSGCASGSPGKCRSSGGRSGQNVGGGCSGGGGGSGRGGVVGFK
eukprot:5052173-Pleurochrysis_carterae.AAC.2